MGGAEGRKDLGGKGWRMEECRREGWKGEGKMEEAWVGWRLNMDGGCMSWGQ